MQNLFILIQGYRELQKIVSEHFDKSVDYNTLRMYCKRNFKTKIKVARKSHIKKNEKLVADFKKKLQQPARKNH